MNTFKKLSIIVPCYNEEETITIFYNEMEKNKKKIGLELEYIFVDDGSKDNTLNILKKLYNKNKENIKTKRKEELLRRKSLSILEI